MRRLLFVKKNISFICSFSRSFGHSFIRSFIILKSGKYVDISTTLHERLWEQTRVTSLDNRFWPTSYQPCSVYIYTLAIPIENLKCFVILFIDTFTSTFSQLHFKFWFIK